jgi:hypothetical protein
LDAQFVWQRHLLLLPSQTSPVSQLVELPLQGYEPAGHAQNELQESVERQKLTGSSEFRLVVVFGCAVMELANTAPT